MKILGFAVFLLILGSEARPPNRQQAPAGHPEPAPNATMDDLDLEYNRYLQEVVQVLESDPVFRKKLEESKPEDIRDGTIAKDLDMLNHKLRTKLDEVKAQELNRLHKLTRQRFELSNGIDRDHIKMPQHLDLNHAEFKVSDLKKLIKSTTDDLEEADRQRREDFKKYEMEKKFEEHERLKHIENEKDRLAEEQRLKDMKMMHKKHEKVHHPMSKDQLEEVWEKQDHMERDEFDPKTFFYTHDLDGDGHLDETEIKTLLNKELDRVYDKDRPEDDLREKYEELERMREHVFKETDKNGDKLISFQEFMDQTKTKEFEHDEGWDTLDEHDPDYSDEEFRQFEEEKHRQIQEMLDRGIIPDGYPYYGNVPPGAHPYQIPGQGVPGSVPGQPAFVPPPGYQGPGQQPQQHTGQAYPQQGHPNQIPNQPVANAVPQQYNVPVQHAAGQPVGQPQVHQPGQPQVQPQAHPQGQPQVQQQAHPQGQPQVQSGQPQGNNIPVQQGQQQQGQNNLPNSAHHV